MSMIVHFDIGDNQYVIVSRQYKNHEYYSICYGKIESITITEIGTTYKIVTPIDGTVFVVRQEMVFETANTAFIVLKKIITNKG